MEKLDLLIKNSTAIMPNPSANHHHSQEKVDIGIKDGKITEIAETIQTEAEKEIDATGLHCFSGVIDSQVHFREPGLEHKEDLASGTRAAVAGGVTTVFEMPNTKPSTTTAEALDDKFNRAKGRCYSNYSFFVGAAPENLDQLDTLEAHPGVCGVKVFMGSSTGSLLIEDKELLRRALVNGKGRVAVHCEDEKRLRERKALVEQSASVYDHPVWRDEKTALLATETLVGLAEETGRPVHVLHVTTAEEMRFLSKAKADQKADVTVEVTPQHLTLFAPDCYDRLGTFAQMNPPIRNKEHREALWMALTAGVVDVIGSDHAPHTEEEKSKTYPNSPSGMTGVQTLLPILLDHVDKGRLSLEHLAQLICRRPAELYRLQNKGEIKVGNDGDLTLVDLAKQQEITNQWIESKSQWTPFNGVTVKGWPMATIVKGHVAMYEGEIFEAKGQACEFLN